MKSPPCTGEVKRYLEEFLVYSESDGRRRSLVSVAHKKENTRYSLFLFQLHLLHQERDFSFSGILILPDAAIRKTKRCCEEFDRVDFQRELLRHCTVRNHARLWETVKLSFASKFHNQTRTRSEIPIEIRSLDFRYLPLTVIKFPPINRAREICIRRTRGEPFTITGVSLF